ncbi:MAG TPA: 50S ribosomal protein L5 [Lentisphaeria bacterium]|nr:MAG: 50S ribosomal protein L5 [Lentisphaerae bacterium GWF2_38_69]HBM16288.1 50S ribosomal protein L5 [Lentisphaeria bacterium]
MPDMFKFFKESVIPKLKEKRNYENPMQIPKLSKIIISTGIGTAFDKDAFAEAKKNITAITGQAALITKSKKDISNFKLRKGQPVGIMVTLRNERMYEFLDRLVHNVLPQVRDFRGISPKGFDGKGNYSFGMNDISVFTEIDLDKLKRPMGINICMVTTAKSNEEAKELLTLLEMPFAKEGSK